ncbi:hypothetical protein, partial [Klebsiella pneumoniae]|uniref:hypothetical protein n=1 Tax=Klebsiella pneumoniae TaxID=573 RepID=UPI003753419C
GKNSLNRLIRCVCGKKIGPDPRNFNQRVSLGRNDLLIRTFLRKIHLTVAIHTPLSCLAKSAEDVVMHQPDVQHVKSRWHGLRFLKCQKQKPDRAVV